MDDNVLKTLTIFDSLLQNQHLLMLKAALPYMASDIQKPLSVVCKLFELNQTIKMSSDDASALSMCSVQSEDKKANTILMLQEVRPFCNDKDKENIDFFIDFLQMYDTYTTLLN